MIQLAELLRRHLADIDADFLAHYGLDVAQIGSAQLRWGRFGGLLFRLPPTSRTIRALTGTDHDWSLPEHLSAAQLDATRVTNYLLGSLLQAHGAKKNPVAKPEPLPRPGAESTSKARKGFRSLFARKG